MSLILFLLLVGIVLVVVELVTPGGLFGLLGTCCMLAGCALAYIQWGGLGGTAVLVGSLLLLGLAFWAEFKLLPKTSFGKKMFIRSAIDSTSQAPVGVDAMVGETGTVVTSLTPSGYVQIKGHRYEAFSNSGLLKAGDSVRVTGHDTFRLIVVKS